MTEKEIDILRALIEACRPFTSGDVVTETSGTIPLIEALEDAIESAEAVIETNEKGV